MSIAIGTPAPDFTLTDTTKNPVTLSALKGENVVLLFFPFAFSSTCTKELCGVRDDINRYQELNARVFGISIDTVYALVKYKQDLNLNFELLCDFNKEACSAYGTMYETFNFGMKGVAKRSAFVIDKAGIVRYAEVLENAGAIPDLDAVKATLNSLN